MLDAVVKVAKFTRRIVQFIVNTDVSSLYFWKDSFQLRDALRVLFFVLFVIVFVGTVARSHILSQVIANQKKELVALKERLEDLESKNQLTQSSDSGNGLSLRMSMKAGHHPVNIFNCQDEQCSFVNQQTTHNGEERRAQYRLK